MSIPDPEDPMVWSCVTVVETLVHRPGLHNLSNWGTHLSDLLMIIRYNRDLRQLSRLTHHEPVGTLGSAKFSELVHEHILNSLSATQAAFGLTSSDATQKKETPR